MGSSLGSTDNDFNKSEVSALGLIGEYQKYQLVSKTEYNHDSVILRFALQTNKTVLGLPIGNHLRIKLQTESMEEPHMRSYTPISDDTLIGYFDLLVKVYDLGVMTQHLNKLAINDSIECLGPLGRINYNEPSNLRITERGEFRNVKASKIGMLAGGTGITPMYQVMQYIHRNRATDDTELSLIFANKTEKDILLKDELKQMVETDDRIKVYHTIEKQETEDQEWNGGIGYISTEMIQEHMWAPEEGVVMLYCGPPPMCKAMKNQLLAIGYPATNVLKF